MAESARRLPYNYTDNQAAIWSAEGRSRAYLLEEIASQIRGLQELGRPVTVRWVPAPGNEAADIAAKEATGWRADGRHHPPAETPPILYPLQEKLVAVQGRARHGLK